jgi:recombination protein RecT
MANKNTAAAAAVAPAPEKREANALAVLRQDVLSNVQKQLEFMQSKGRIHFPANYSAANALQSAWLKLQDTTDKNSRPVLETCTRASVMNCLLKTVVSGLNPAKDQVYYIATAGVLTVFVSYFGTTAMAKRHGMADDPFTEVVYKGDEFEYEIDPASRTKTVTKHTQKIENIKADSIIAAYAVAPMSDGTYRTEIMTIDQIHKNWMRGQAKGQSPMHKDHPEQACRRTVISRLCKMIVKASDDSDLVLDLFDEADDLEVAAEIDENANQTLIDITPELENDLPEAVQDEEPENPQDDPEQDPPAAADDRAPGQLSGQLKMNAGF